MVINKLILCLRGVYWSDYWNRCTDLKGRLKWINAMITTLWFLSSTTDYTLYGLKLYQDTSLYENSNISTLHSWRQTPLPDVFFLRVFKRDVQVTSDLLYPNHFHTMEDSPFVCVRLEHRLPPCLFYLRDIHVASQTRQQLYRQYRGMTVLIMGKNWTGTSWTIWYGTYHTSMTILQINK